MKIFYNDLKNNKIKFQNSKALYNEIENFLNYLKINDLDMLKKLNLSTLFINISKQKNDKVVFNGEPITSIFVNHTKYGLCRISKTKSFDLPNFLEEYFIQTFEKNKYITIEPYLIDSPISFRNLKDNPTFLYILSQINLQLIDFNSKNKKKLIILIQDIYIINNTIKLSGGDFKYFSKRDGFYKVCEKDLGSFILPIKNLGEHSIPNILTLQFKDNLKYCIINNIMDNYKTIKKNIKVLKI